ncbi:MAG: SDR family NAD(P)-dependent oxidoreductase, partial [Acidobacteria bacterium]|nr:SDR family NAD(P)-dependent oxidoreductase [Acidobacteriota bacterium]
MNRRFDGQVVWVTGASSGIGESLVRAFSAEGARVVLSARRESELHRVAATCSGPTEN